MKYTRLLWVLMALGLILLAGAGVWLGQKQAAEGLQLEMARRPQPASTAETLVLPLPPSFHTAPIDSADPTSKDVNAIAARAAPAGEPPPGGYPVDVAVEMWEAWLNQPRKIGDKALTADAWRITGVVVRESVQEVIVQQGTDPKPQFRRVGDTLPGGARIVWIRPNAIGLVTPKRERISLPVRPS